MFEEIIGHGETIKKLKAAVSRGEIHHAYLFHGPDGVGKRTTAIALAAALNCQNPLEGDSCGECPSCLQIKKSVHPNLHWVLPEKKSIKIEQIRDLQEKLSYRRWQGNYTLAIIEEVDLMTTQAGNSLLKFLEEPNPGVCFILLTSRPESILPTILSRSQRLAFMALADEEIISFLEKRSFQGEKIKQIARLSNGKPSKALAMLENEELLAQREQAHHYCNLLSQGGVNEALTVAEKLFTGEGETLMDWMGLWWRDCLVWQLSRKEKLLVNLDYISEIKNNKLKIESLKKALLELETGRYRLSRNGIRKLTFDVMALKINQGFSESRLGGKPW